MPEEVLIEAENIGKKFCRSLRRSLWYGARDILGDINPLAPAGPDRSDLRKEEFWALRDISFQLRRGECLGLIGHNGAGKSTLLKIINGLIKPDTGRLTVRGKVGALIELSAGFNPILTGRENIYNRGALLGFTRHEIDQKFDAIVDFAEIGDFIDMPVQNYSSGMQVRLGFAVSIQMDPDVLILDEVLAVGDIAFRFKCINAMSDLLSNAAVIFVSHSMPQIYRVSTQVMVLSRGRIHHWSESVGEGIDRYHSLLETTAQMVTGSGEVSLLDCRLTAGDDRKESVRTLLLKPEEPFRMTLELGIADHLNTVQVQAVIWNQEMIPVAEIVTESGTGCLASPASNSKSVLLEASVPGLPLNGGRYSISICVVSEDYANVYCRHDNAAFLTVSNSNVSGAHFIIPSPLGSITRAFGFVANRIAATPVQTMEMTPFWDDATIVELEVERIDSDDLLELANHFGSDKGNRHGAAHGYTRFYERHLLPLRIEPVHLLEIGVARGSSLKMWASYFPNSQVEGIDLNPAARELCSDFPKISITIDDAKSHDFGDAIFDVIIDDGSHLPSDIIRTWKNLESHTGPGTVYVIEDLHSANDREYIQHFHQLRKPDCTPKEWLEENSPERLATFLEDLSVTHHVKIHDDKIAFITRRGNDGGPSSGITFSFGENWLEFLDTVDNESVAESLRDLDEWIGIETIRDARVIDIGSGSGLSSLAFAKAGCGSLLSVDADPKSVAATRKLAEANPLKGAPWTVRENSILNAEFVEGAGNFDIVYSWGVLHHTGSMWQAIANAAALCAPGGWFWISIYAGGPRFREDLALKQEFNASEPEHKERMIQARIRSEKKNLQDSGQDPENWNRRKERGMTVQHDIIDWLGGLPYEVARPSEILVFCHLLELKPVKVLESPEGGCSSYLFRRADANVPATPEENTFLYSNTWSAHRVHRTIPEQVTADFERRDDVFLETRRQLMRENEAVRKRAALAEGKMNSGWSLLSAGWRWIRAKFRSARG